MRKNKKNIERPEAPRDRKSSNLYHIKYVNNYNHNDTYNHNIISKINNTISLIKLLSTSNGGKEYGC